MKFLTGDTFAYLLLTLNILAAIAYGIEYGTTGENSAKFLYFLGGSILTVGVVLMK